MDRTFQLGRGTADRVSSVGGVKIVKSSHAVGRFMVDRFAHVRIGVLLKSIKSEPMHGNPPEIEISW